MKAKTRFYTKTVQHGNDFDVVETEMVLDTKKLDRNYDDENYAYWIIHEDNGYIHEVNIDKDSDGFFKHSGMDKIWFTMGCFEDCTDPDAVADLTFTFSD